MSRITHRRAYRFRIYPTPDQEERLRQTAGVCRLVYNLALEQRRDHWRQFKRATGSSISFASQCRELTALRAEFDWIAAAGRTTQDQALRDLDRAFSSFFAGRSGYPNPRALGSNDTFRERGSACRIRKLNSKWAALKMGAVGIFKVRTTCRVDGRIAEVTVMRRAGAWFAAVGVEQPVPTGNPQGAQVGIDRGIATTLMLSTGEAFQAPDASIIMAQRKRAQRTLARRKKGSARRWVAKARVAALSARAGRIRTDWCHKASTDIARRFGLAAIEDLKIKNMTASAAGTVAEPGRGVAQKRGLNRSILEQCWGRFAGQLDYKLTERGGVLISVPPHFTSQTCACCGVVDARSRESQAVFASVHCGHTDNADVNAAKEILRRGTAWLGVEAQSTGPLKRQSQDRASRDPKPAAPGFPMEQNT